VTEGSTTLATFTLGSGPATFTTTYPSASIHTLVASYSGDTNFQASSFTLRQVVKRDATTTVVSSSPNPSTLGQNVTYTATVTASAPGVGQPTGTVLFLAGKFTLGTATLDGSGVATLVSSGAPLGVSTISAIYGGDSNFQISTGKSTQTVNSATIGSTVIAASAVILMPPLDKSLPMTTLLVAPATAPLSNGQYLASGSSPRAVEVDAVVKNLALSKITPSSESARPAPSSAGELDVANVDRFFSDF
jgi:hypothetical protein